MWYEKKKLFLEGIQLITAKLSDEKFTSFLKKYSSEELDEDFTQIELETLTQQESLLVSKTFYYLVQRLKLFLLSPNKLQSDLTELGFSSEKAEIVVKDYSEAARNITKNFGDSSENDTNIFWDVKTTLDETNLRNKKPIARISFKANDVEMNFEDLDHQQLADLFDKFENIQKQLDMLSAKKMIIN